MADQTADVVCAACGRNLPIVRITHAGDDPELHVAPCRCVADPEPSDGE